MKTNVFYHGDCLFVMNHDIEPESVDLIYLDPPFFTGEVQEGSNKGYLFNWNKGVGDKLFKYLKKKYKIDFVNKPEIEESDNKIEIKGRHIVSIVINKDNRNAILEINGINVERLKVIKKNDDFRIQREERWNPAAMQISYDDSKKFWGNKENIKELRKKGTPEWLIHLSKSELDGEAFASYLLYMMKRLQECYRVLKPTGSIYLHCDWRASHYLRMIMDEIFGRNKFRDDIVWHYFMGGKAKKQWSRKHDNILFYTMGNEWTFIPQRWKRRLDFKPSLVNESRDGETGKDELGYYSLVGGDDVWDIKGVFNMANEYVDYPTQKPEALLKRIILASSNPKDIVLDPFCGCGTTIVSSHDLDRQWIGIDINSEAIGVIKNRCSQLKIDKPLKPVIVERTLKYVKEIIKGNSKAKGYKFEKWVNDFYNAKKPIDKGVDGITQKGIPIQTKTFEINDTIVNGFYGQAKMHSDVPKPLKIIRLVSGTGFNKNARQAKDDIENIEGINVELLTPKDMLNE